MTSAINEIDMEFEEIKNDNIETIGSLSQITRLCPIKYKSMKEQHPQVQQTSCHESCFLDDCYLFS
jgi:hypothetical protein